MCTSLLLPSISLNKYMPNLLRWQNINVHKFILYLIMTVWPKTYKYTYIFNFCQIFNNVIGHFKFIASRILRKTDFLRRDFNCMFCLYIQHIQIQWIIMIKSVIMLELQHSLTSVCKFWLSFSINYTSNFVSHRIRQTWFSDNNSFLVYIYYC